jgi:hypothetical protein
MGNKVLFIHSNDMVNKLISSKGDGSYFSLLKELLNVFIIRKDFIPE